PAHSHTHVLQVTCRQRFRTETAWKGTVSARSFILAWQHTGHYRCGANLELCFSNGFLAKELFRFFVAVRYGLSTSCATRNCNSIYEKKSILGDVCQGLIFGKRN